MRLRPVRRVPGPERGQLQDVPVRGAGPAVAPSHDAGEAAARNQGMVRRAEGEGREMQKYGGQRQHPRNLPDNHPQKGRVNWWEAEFHDGNKKRARQRARREIEEGIAMVESQPGLSEHLRIEVFQQDWVPGFAAFGEGSVEHEGHAHVVLNLGALLSAVANEDLDVKDLPYVIAESIMHEVIHALEEWACVEFSEDRVYALIQGYQEKYKGAAPVEGPNPEEAARELDEAIERVCRLSNGAVADDIKAKWQAFKFVLGMEGDSE